MKNLNVAELFAGVGGFRVGLERSSKSFFKVVYMNQWEPANSKQHAFECYINNFGQENSEIQKYENIDIKIVNDNLEKNTKYIPFNIDLIVGGFPCQDYSVAATNSKGIEGKKGVLWWEIYRIVSLKKPSYLLLENVDRLLKSPRNQKGRDFLIMLATLNQLGYNVEWRIINAADYGYVQRRKRVFIFAYLKKSKIKDVYKRGITKNLNNSILTRNINIKKISTIKTYKIKKSKSIKEISDNEQFIFSDYGQMRNGKIQTFKFNSVYEGKKQYLNEIILPEKETEDLILNDEQKEKIFSLKNGRKIVREKNGFKYFYSEGKMNHYDNIAGKPARTMLTSEGSINRSSHIIKINENKYRFLHPKEAEILNGFDIDWTKSVPKKTRYFLMGNALVVNLIEKIGDNIKFYSDNDLN